MSLARKGLWRLEVEWADSVTENGRWQAVSAVLENREITRCHSVGFVLADDKRGLVLASTVGRGEATGVVHIPAGAIIRRRRLR